jgi:hypothetical protein
MSAGVLVHARATPQDTMREITLRRSVRSAVIMGRWDAQRGALFGAPDWMTPVGHAAYVHGRDHGDRECCTAFR